ncbi:TolC family protein [Chitinibacter sp. GC72]|uniref:TolC family protein n=1 Tax=Chitinibacter sp. GC72 TaxID=1526917 RepID=UPI0012FCB1E3|nr:TolC family protein [Chitinibacter sp. GC72]
MQSMRFRTCVACCVFIALPVQAGSIREAFELASASDALILAAQQGKTDNTLRNARALTPEPPSLTISAANSLDQQLLPKQGAREYEVELGIPLWQWGQKERLQAQLQHAGDAEQSQLLLARWELAGAVREAVWAARIAQHEQALAQQKVILLQKTVDDLARQLKAGEVAPLDHNLANQALLEAQLQLAERTQQAGASVQHFQALVGEQTPLPDRAETLVADKAETFTPNAEVSRVGHPQRLLWQAQARLAQSQLAQAQFDTRDTPELAFSLTRERGDVAEAYQNRGRISLRIPFGSDGRTQARISSANLELITAQTGAQRAERQIGAQQQAATQALELAKQNVEFQRKNLQFANQAWNWQQRSYRAGQTSLSAYLMAQTAFLERSFAAQRAELELGLAHSRYLQTLGVLP